MRVAMRAPFDVVSGYGNDAVDLALTLANTGFDVVPFPTSIMPGLPSQFLALLSKDPTLPPDVVLGFAPPYDLRPSAFAKNVRAVGYTMWERSRMLPREFDGHGWDEETRTDPAGRLAHLDALAVTCGMNVDAFAKHAPGVPTSVVPCGVNGDRFPTVDRDTDRPMRFLMVGALGPRKNPFATLDAWRELKRDVDGFDAQLTMHTTAAGLHPAIADVYGPDLTVHTGTISNADLLALYHDHDVMLCPSRGEGNNKPPMEFMATGGTVIASNWSGHQNWLHRDVNYAVPGELMPSPLLDPVRPNVLDFEIDAVAYKTTILDVWRNRHQARRKGQFAAQFVRSACSWDNTVRALRPLLEGQS